MQFYLFVVYFWVLQAWFYFKKEEVWSFLKHINSLEQHGSISQLFQLSDDDTNIPPIAILESGKRSFEASYSVGVACNQNSHHRNSMEDRYVIISNQRELCESYFGIYDGIYNFFL